MAIDYFIKWIKVEALVTITETNIENFVWKPIVYRFNIIRVLVIDNGKQFNNQMCKEFYTTITESFKKILILLKFVFWSFWRFNNVFWSF